MKKTAITAAILLASAGAAQAQLSIYGLIDASYGKSLLGDVFLNEKADFHAGGDNGSSEGNSTTRVGIKGAVDVGSGIKANFRFETGGITSDGEVNPGGAFFNRQAWFGFSGGFGEVRLGRDFTPIYTGWSDFDAFSDNGVAAGGKFSDRIGSNVDTLTRSDNQLTYLLPAMGGVYGQLSVAAGEGAAGRKMIAGRVGYSAGPLNVSVALGRTEVTPTAGSDEHEVITLGGSYDLGVMRVLAYWRQNEFGAGKVTVTSIGATVPLRSGTFRASFTRADGSGRTPAGTLIGDNDADQFALGYVHNLSKRSALYATYARVANDGRATYATGTPPALAAGATSTGYEFGVRHSF